MSCGRLRNCPINTANFKGGYWGVLINRCEAWATRLPDVYRENNDLLLRHSTDSVQIPAQVEGSEVWRVVRCCGSQYASGTYTQNGGEDFVYFWLEFEKLSARGTRRAGFARVQVCNEIDQDVDPTSHEAVLTHVWMLAEGTEWSDTTLQPQHYEHGATPKTTCVGKDGIYFVRRDYSSTNIQIDHYAIGASTPTTLVYESGETGTTENVWRIVTLCPHAAELALWCRLSTTSESGKVRSISREFSVSTRTGSTRDNEPPGNFVLESGVWNDTVTTTANGPNITLANTIIKVIDWRSTGEYVSVSRVPNTDDLIDDCPIDYNSSQTTKDRKRWRGVGIVEKAAYIDSNGDLTTNADTSMALGDSDTSANIGRMDVAHYASQEGAIGAGPANTSPGAGSPQPLHALRVFAPATNVEIDRFFHCGVRTRLGATPGSGLAYPDSIDIRGGVDILSFEEECSGAPIADILMQMAASHPQATPSPLVQAAGMIAVEDVTAKITSSNPSWWTEYQNQGLGTEVVYDHAWIHTSHTFRWTTLPDEGFLYPPPRGEWIDPNGDLIDSPLAYDASFDDLHPSLAEVRTL